MSTERSDEEYAEDITLILTLNVIIIESRGSLPYFQRSTFLQRTVFTSICAYFSPDSHEMTSLLEKAIILYV